MPRDSSGAYSLPAGTLVNTGDTVLVAQHNPAMQDIAQSMGNSLSRDGLGGMRAPLDLGGFKIFNLADGTNPSDAATVGQGLPVGSVLDYAGTSAPTGFLLCYGQAISRVTYAALFAVIGTTHGAGDGSTTFNLPDLRGRVAAGKDDMGGVTAARLSNFNGTTLGAGGGRQEHTLVTAEMPAHSHGVTDPGHTHLIGDTLRNSGGLGNTSPGGVIRSDLLTTSPSTTGISIQNAGGGAAHDNVQPTLILNKIIKASS